MYGRIAVLLLVSAVLVFAQQEPPASDQGQQSPQAQPFPEKNAPPPRSSPPRNSNDSSSRDTQIDLSPPPADVAAHPESYEPEVHEMHPYNPHKADKDVEVGDFYLKRKNYGAAISRYCEALHWMSNHALATYHLAEALDKAGDLAGARQQYEAYLKILPEGPSAPDAKKAIARIDRQSEQPSKRLAQRAGCELSSSVASSEDDSRQLRPISPPEQTPR